MKYKSPLFIVPQKDLDKIDATYLKRLRKQLMLRFDLNNSSTIKLNGREYDKTNILDAIERLEQGTEYHIRLFQNRDLLRFVEKGDIVFNKNPASWKDLEDPGFQEWVRPYFVEQYSKMMYDIASKKGFASVNKLRLINDSGFQLPKSFEDEAYAGAYRFIKHTIEEFNDKFANPFTDSKKLTLKKEVKEYLDVHYHHVLEKFPPAYVDLKNQYSRVLRDVVYKAFKEDIYFKNINRDTLVDLKHFAEMSLAMNKEGEVRRLLGDINSYLNEGGTYTRNTEKEVSPWRSILLVFVIVFFLFRLVTLADSCSSRQQYGSNSYDDIRVVEQSSARQKKLLRIQEKNKKSRPSNLKINMLTGEWSQQSALGYEGEMITRKVEYLDWQYAIVKYVVNEKSSDTPCEISVKASWKLENNWLLYSFGDEISINCPVKSSSSNLSDDYLNDLKEKLRGATEKESVVRIIQGKTLHTQHTGPLFEGTSFIYKKGK